MEIRLAAHFALASIAAVSVVAKSDASVIYSGVVNWNCPANFDGLYMNFETGEHSSNAGLAPGWDVNLYGDNATLGAFFYTPGAYPGIMTPATSNLLPGTSIGSTNLFGNASGPFIGAGVGDWRLNGSGYFGIQFQMADLTVHYGWVNFAYGATGLERTVIGYAYESEAGVSILAGDGVPAPGAIALLAIAGAFGRRRRS